MNKLDIFNELSEYITIRVNSCNKESHNSNWIESKVHSDYDIWLLLKGTIHIKIKDFSFTAATPGDLIFFYPHTFYTASTEAEGCEFIYIHFDFRLGNQLRILNAFQLPRKISGDCVFEQAQLFKSAFEDYQNEKSLSRLTLKGSLTILLAQIIEVYSDKSLDKEKIKGNIFNQVTENLDALQPVFSYIHYNLNKKMKIEKLAEIAGMSEKYFSSYFKNRVGIAPGNYITQLKMNRARDFLYHKKHSIKEISDLLGYPDPYTFSKAFKKYYHVPPSKFI